MSRFRRVVHGVASGYVSLGFASLYSLATVPLALHYLSKERFALWLLMSSITGYLNLIDFGMSGSIARLLIDHKDAAHRGWYGGLIKTGSMVLVSQAGLIFLIGFGLAPVFCELLAIQVDLKPEFIALLRWQTGSLAVSFGLRIFSQLLMAHQRSDIYNYSQTCSLGANFVALWLFFHAGQGVFSLAWASLIASLTGSVLALLACARLGFFPKAGAWGAVSWAQFREIFGYGKDIFLVAVGTQLLMASQTMIITRRLGLEVAAIWAIGTRTFSLVSQLIWRVSDVAGPAFSEMIVRNESVILRERYRAILLLTGSLSACAAVIFAMCNSLFVTVWTHGKIYWRPECDLLLAVWMFILAVLHVHNGFVLLTKKIEFMRYVYFVEGLVFVILAFLAARWGGLAAIIACSIVCSTLFSGAYGVYRMSRYFGVGIYEVGIKWLRPAFKVLLWFAPIGAVTWWVSRSLGGTIAPLALNALIGGGVGAFLLLRHGLPSKLGQELVARAPSPATFLLRRLVRQAPH